MMGRIIKDYFGAFRWSNFKTKVANLAYMVVYFTSILPVLGGFFEKAEYALIYFMIAIPIIHIMNSSCIHTMKLPKLMYMVPLSQEMKREYIVKSTIFRICFCTGLGVICALPILLLDLCNIVTFFLIIYNALTLALLLCGMTERSSIKVVNMCVTFISIFLIACMLCMDVKLMTKEVPLLFLIPAVLIQLPLTIKHMSYWNTAVDKAMSYEASYDK